VSRPHAAGTGEEGRWVALAVVFLARVSMGFQFQSVASVGPFLAREFGLTHLQLGGLVGLYMLPGVAVAVPGGLLGRRFGDRRVVLAGLVLMAAGAVVTGLARGVPAATAGRAASGAGAVLLNVLLAKMVADWFAGKELSTAMAVMLTAWPVGIGLASATLGATAERASWRVAVHGTAGVAALAALLLLGCYRDPGPRAAAPARPRPRGSVLPARGLALALAAGGGWALFNAALIGFVAFAPGWLVAGGRSVGQAGVLVSVTLWVSLASIPLGGWLADRRRDADRLVVAGCLLCAAAMAALVVLPWPAVWCALLGLAVGLPPGPLNALLPRALAGGHLAAGLGVYQTVNYVGMAAAAPAAGAVLDLTASAAAPVLLAAAGAALTPLGLAGFRRLEPPRAAGGGRAPDLLAYEP